ncbi:MAG: hypothetical protein K940chlam9_01348, partial [Chlamydiae bacterium]|nr:hypothetical protein [Chlamydiota bacterium]
TDRNMHSGDCKIIKVFASHKEILFLSIGALALGSWLVYKDYSSLSRSIERLVKNGNKLEVGEREEVVNSFLDQNWNKLGLPIQCNNENNKKYIRSKLMLILAERLPSVSLQGKKEEIIDPSQEEKKEIIERMLNNFSEYISHSYSRILSDLEKDDELKTLFDIRNNTKIVKIEILGDESHNKGKNPLCIGISLGNGKRLVYKPRSTLPEKLICGSEDSYFYHLRLPTYRVYDKTNENYGYCEFLVNSEKENTFDTIEKLKNLYIEFGKIEKAARAIGLGDIHKENVIISEGRPYLIDTEVVLLPEIEEYQTDLFALNDGGARSSSPECKNHIWLDASLNNDQKNLDEATFKNLLIHDGICDRVVNAIGFRSFLESIEQLTHKEIENFEIEGEQDVHGRLQDLKNRIVLVSTDSLSALIREKIGTAKNNFINDVGKGLEHWGFEVNEDALQQSLAKFEEDLLNHDVPIFYHVPSKGTVYYGEYVIGNIQQS